jgi:hypothetical protein
MKKAEQFRRDTLRPHPKKATPKKAKPAGPDTSLVGVSATAKKRGAGHTAPRNRSQHADRKATFALEDSATGRPSRKSSRASANHIKPDNNLRRRQSRRTASPKARARRGK